MNKNGCVIIIEDDEDDQFLLQEAFKKLNYTNEIIFFRDGLAALDFLTTGNKNPFLILSDIHLPKLSGFELRKKIKLDAELHLKCVPYLYFTGSSNHKDVIDAYSTSVQGFFTKSANCGELEYQIKVIMEYWTQCSAPNHFLSEVSS